MIQVQVSQRMRLSILNHLLPLGLLIGINVQRGVVYVDPYQDTYNIICQPVRFLSIHSEYVAIILTSSTIYSIRISVYSPPDILLDVTHLFFCLLCRLYFVCFLSSILFANKYVQRSVEMYHRTRRHQEFRYYQRNKLLATYATPPSFNLLFDHFLIYLRYWVWS